MFALAIILGAVIAGAFSVISRGIVTELCYNGDDERSSGFLWQICTMIGWCLFCVFFVANKDNPFSLWVLVGVALMFISAGVTIFRGDRMEAKILDLIKAHSVRKHRVNVCE